MYAFLRKELTVFLVGFVIAFVIYLFVRFDPNKVLVGLGVSAVAGVALMIALALLERQFPEETGADTPKPVQKK